MKIRNVRLEKAKILPRGEPLRIDRIANLCGYSSLSSFSNFLRAETGLSPPLGGSGARGDYA